MLQQMFEYISTHGDRIIEQILTHTGLSLAALLGASLIGLPCGYLASRSHRSEIYITAPFEMLRVVPSLALLILMIPILGTGFGPSLTALTILAIPPVLLNTIVGFKEVPDFMIESARGIGMTDRELLYQVRIPLALPMILAGMKTALVEVFASATLAARIGAGGLGEIIFTGLGMARSDLLLLGGALVAGLSLLAGCLFDRFSRLLMRYRYID